MLKLIALLKSFVGNKSKKMDWNNLTGVDQLNEIDANSENKTQVIFKHSTRCSVSTFAKRILTSEYNDEIGAQAEVHYLDLIAYRDVSNAIAERYGVMHESPQILVIKNGKCVFDASHSDVSFEKALA